MPRTLAVLIGAGGLTVGLAGGVHAQHALGVSLTIPERSADEVEWQVDAARGALTLQAVRVSPDAPSAAASSRALEHAWLEPGPAGAAVVRRTGEGGAMLEAAHRPLRRTVTDAAPLVVPAALLTRGQHRLVLTRVIAAHS